MFGELHNHFVLTRPALIAGRRAKSQFLSVLLTGAVGIAVAAAVPHSLFAFEYRGNCSVNYSVYATTNQEQPMVLRRFSLDFSISNQHWAIQGKATDRTDDYEYISASYDGTNVCEISKMNEVKYLSAISATDQRANTNMMVNIYPCDVPPVGVFPLNFTWLAFCSGTVFGQRSDKRVRPVWAVRERAIFAMDYYVRSEFHFLNASPPVIGNCLFFNDGRDYNVFADPTPRAGVAYEYPTPFSTGFVKSQYSVLQTTNIAGVTFPYHFELRIFSPRQGATSTNDVLLQAKYEGHLNHLEYGMSDPAVKDDIYPRATVVDHRTLTMSPPLLCIIYRSPTNRVLAMSMDAIPYKLYKQSQEGRVRHGTEPRTHFARLVLFVIVSASGCGFWWICSQHNKTQHKGKTV